MKRLLSLGAVLAALVGAPAAAAQAPAPFASCGDNGLVCATLSVPLDYANPAAGQVPLYVEELPAVGKPRGVMIMLAGGPGQASAETFNLGLKAAYWRAFFPGYTLVAYDDRGTGKSGPIDCPRAPTIAACGSAITARAHYTTPEHGEDIESVRLALGVDKVAVWGVSYGTKHAVAYALAHRATSSACCSTPRCCRTRTRSTRCRCASSPPQSTESVPTTRARASRRAPATGSCSSRTSSRPTRSRPRSPSAGAGAVPGHPRRPDAALPRLRERSQLGRVVPAARGDRRRAGRLDAAAAAARVPRPGQQHRLVGRHQHRAAPDHELRRRPVPVGPERHARRRQAALDAAVAALPAGSAARSEAGR